MDNGTIGETGEPEDRKISSLSGSNTDIRGLGKKAVLAGIGAAAEACEQAEERFDRYARRGQQTAQQFQDRAEEVRQQNVGARGRITGYVQGAMDMVLNTLNVPSKGDVAIINTKLNILTRKLDELQVDRVRAANRESESDASSPPPPPPPPTDFST